MRKKIYKRKENLTTSELLMKMEKMGNSHVRGENYLKAALAAFKLLRKFAPITGVVEAIERLSPGVRLIQEIRSGRIVYLSARINHRASIYYAIKWLYSSARSRDHKTSIPISMATDLEDVIFNRGFILTYKNDLNQGVLASRPLMRQKKIKARILKERLPGKHFSSTELKVEAEEFDPENESFLLVKAVNPLIRDLAVLQMREVHDLVSLTIIGNHKIILTKQ
jgi:ribosomal protein S7